MEITANSVHPGVVDTDIFRHHKLFRGNRLRSIDDLIQTADMLCCYPTRVERYNARTSFDVVYIFFLPYLVCRSS